MLPTATKTLLLTLAYTTITSPVHPSVRTVYNPPITPASASVRSPTPRQLSRPPPIEILLPTFHTVTGSRLGPQTTSSAACPLLMPSGIIGCKDHFGAVWEGRGMNGIKTLFYPSQEEVIQQPSDMGNGLSRIPGWDCRPATEQAVLCEMNMYTLLKAGNWPAPAPGLAKLMRGQEGEVVQRIGGNGKDGR